MIAYADIFLILKVGERKKVVMKNLYEILLYLEDIKNCVSSYLYYLNNPEKDLDNKEIDMYMSAIPEIVDELKELIINLYEEKSE